MSLWKLVKGYSFFLRRLRPFGFWVSSENFNFPFTSNFHWSQLFLFSERSGWLIWKFHYLEVALFLISSYFVFLILTSFLFTVNLSFALSFVNCLKFWHHALIIAKLLSQPNSLWSIFLFVSPFLLCFIHILTYTCATCFFWGKIHINEPF